MKTRPLAYASALRHAVMTTMKTHQIVNIMLHFMESGLKTVATAMSLITIRSIPTAKAYTVHTSLTSIG